MFSGIVETLGVITHLISTPDYLQLTIAPQMAFSDLKIGDSVAVNGVCLTVTTFDSRSFQVTLVPETLRLTNLGKLAQGDKVNLERALQANARIGGHYVQGHVDGLAEIIDLEADGANALIAKIRPAHALCKYIVNKGYIALDGMSITVIAATTDWFTVTFIPHTRAVTIASQYQVGSQLNIEVDILGRYVEKLLRA